MRIAILGAGHVGAALGINWSRRGHEVYFGVRNPQAADTKETLAACANGARAGSVAVAAGFSDVVVVALPWSAVERSLPELDLTEKIVIDCTNAAGDIAAAEAIARMCPGAKVAKCFNTTGANNMANPHYSDGASVMFACSDDDSAKKTALQLASDAGFETYDFGPLSNARMLESFARMWIWLASRGGLGREFAFRLVKR